MNRKGENSILIVNVKTRLTSQMHFIYFFYQNPDSVTRKWNGTFTMPFIKSCSLIFQQLWCIFYMNLKNPSLNRCILNWVLLMKCINHFLHIKNTHFYVLISLMLMVYYIKILLAISYLTEYSTAWKMIVWWLYASIAQVVTCRISH